MRPSFMGGALATGLGGYARLWAAVGVVSRGLGEVMMAADDLVLAMTGASGAPYGVRLLEVLLRAGRTVHLTLSPAGAEVLLQETGRRVRLERFELRDLLADA